MYVEHFADLEDEFLEHINTYVYCNMATIDTKNRPRSRIIHAVWEGRVGWLVTWRESLKAKHLAHNPHVSLSYFCHDMESPVYIECTAQWENDRDEMMRVWDYYQVARRPMGFDLEPHYGDIDNEKFGLLKLIPWRVELFYLNGESKIWIAE